MIIIVIIVAALLGGLRQPGQTQRRRWIVHRVSPEHSSLQVNLKLMLDLMLNLNLNLGRRGRF
ncbi:GL24225 [Drosophila persimilis]|uniref:GL24225 n=1 Tax=Drosophila persimilis TaxID=7234 RepID=B4G4R2_DROPE|nr:GL24225 [Drosophila persimilis]